MDAMNRTKWERPSGKINMLKSEMQHQYWLTKKTVQRKLGGKEDECIISSDAELDAKIELFNSITTSCCSLQRIIDTYQERLCVLAQEENTVGRFLKEVGKNSSTSSNVMCPTGKAIAYAGQQRILLRQPILRLYQEVDTFRGCAISDLKSNIQLMEKSRTEYRAALSWMKSISAQLDPDSGRGIEKFRQAQNTCRVAKSKFDRQSLDCLEKIDLLAAARCNMFSHALANYMTTMIQFAKKTTEIFDTTIESLSKCEPVYNFNVLKELAGTSDIPDQPKQETPISSSTNKLDADQQLFFKEEFKDETSKTDQLINLSQNESECVAQEELKSVDLLGTCSNDNLVPIESTMSTKSDTTQNVIDTVTDLLNLDMPSYSSLCNGDAPILDLDNPINDTAESTAIMEKSWNDLLDEITMDQSFTSTSNTVKNINKPIDNNSSKQPEKKGVASWYKLFADLDPLANPDAIDSKFTNPTNSKA